jgi:hypothetical protein
MKTPRQTRRVEICAFQSVNRRFAGRPSKNTTKMDRLKMPVSQ